MLAENDNQDEQPEPGYAVLAQYCGKQIVSTAKALDKDRNIYYLYSVLDSLSSSYSMFRYFYEIVMRSNSTNAVHDFMLSPEGICIIIAETLFLVGFSYYASIYDQEADKPVHEQVYRKVLIATAWPYFRDLMKGLKNGYKGWRSGVFVIDLIGHYALSAWFFPVGIALGVFMALNRLMLKQIFEKRKKMKKDNGNLLSEIKNKASLNKQSRQLFLDSKKIQVQTDSERYTAYVGTAIGGIIDGLYLYVGVLLLAALTPHVLLPLAIICGIYTVGCSVAHIFEEHEYQLEIDVSESKCKLALIMKQIESTYKNDYRNLLNADEVQKKLTKNALLLTQFETEFIDLVDEFDTIRSKLIQQITRPYWSAVLLGVKNGLYAYSAVSSAVFFVGAMLLLASVPCPPLFLLITIPLGLVFIAGFITQAVVENYYLLQKQQKQLNNSYAELMVIRGRVRAEELSNANLIQDEKFLQYLEEGANVEVATPFAYKDCFEIIRSFFSGITKGQKFVEFAGNPLQQLDDHGQYRDSPIMLGLISASGLLFSVVLALRALAKGFGRPPLGQLPAPAANASTTINVSTETNAPTPTYVPIPTVAVTVAELVNEPISGNKDNGNPTPSISDSPIMSKIKRTLSVTQFSIFKEPIVPKNAIIKIGRVLGLN